MALRVKAVEKLLKFSKNENDPGVWRYVMMPELYTALSGQSDQGGSPPLWREPRRDAGLLGCSR